MARAHHIVLPPARTEQQRQEAIDLAMEYRRRRGDVRKRITAGEVSASSVIYSQDPAYQRLKVRDVLKSLPNIGDSRADLILEKLRISKKRRIGGLGHHQKTRLAQWLDYYQSRI